MPAQNNQEVILAALLLDPSLQEVIEVPKHLFIEKERKLFNAIVQRYEDIKSPDITDIGETSGIKDAHSYIGKLIEGIQRFKPDGFVYLVNKTKRKDLEGKLFKEFDKQKDFYLKGMSTDLDEMQGLFDQINNLNHDKELNFESFKQLYDMDISERKILVDPIIGSEEIVILSGFPKIGKSLLSINLAVKLAQGRSWLNFEIPQPVRVLIFQAEVAASLFQDRIKKMFASEDDLSFMDQIIHVKQRGLLLNTNTGFSSFSKTIEAVKPELVIIDPLIEYHDLKENDASDMAKAFQRIRKIVDDHHVSILIIHHFAKLIEGREGGYMARGSGVISASSDSNWQFQRLHREKYHLSEDEYFKTVELSFESRNCEIMKPKIVRLNENLWFEQIELQRRTKLDEWEIVEAIQDSGGQILQSEVESLFVPKICSHSTFVRAIECAENRGIIDSVETGSKGGAKMLMVLEREIVN